MYVPLAMWLNLCVLSTSIKTYIDLYMNILTNKIITSMCVFIGNWDICKGRTGVQDGERLEGPNMQRAPPTRVDPRSPTTRRIDEPSGQGEMNTPLYKYLPYE
jgi:hypothetical protein